MSLKEITPAGKIKPSKNAPHKIGNDSGKDSASSGARFDAKNQPDVEPSSAQGKDSSPTKNPSETNSNLVVLVGKNTKTKSTKRKRTRRNIPTVTSCPAPDEANLYVCQDFLKYRCRRGPHCAFLHVKPAKRPMVDDLPVPVDDEIPSIFQSVVKVCRNSIHNMCPSGGDCRLYHPPMEISDGVTETVTLFAICKNFLEDSCDNFECRSVVSVQQDILDFCHHHSFSSSTHIIQYSIWPSSSNFFFICIQSLKASFLTFLSVPYSCAIYSFDIFPFHTLLPISSFHYVP